MTRPPHPLRVLMGARRGWFVVWALVVASLGLALAGTTPASAAPFTYGAATLTRVDARAGGAAGSAPLVSEARQRSASRPVEARGASTTGLVESVAPNTVSGSGALRSVNEILDGMQKGNQSWVRMVSDESSLMTKFNELTEGGTPTTWKKFDGTVIERSDGVQVGLRGTSGSGGGAIDIRMPDGSRIRIHVEQP